MRLVLLVLAIVFAAFLAPYIMSLIFFIVMQGSTTPSPGMGAAVHTLISLPWLLILLMLALVGLLEFLVVQFEFAYRRPLVLSLFAVLITIMALGAFAAYTDLHERALKRSRDARGLPVMGPMYRHYMPRKDPALTSPKSTASPRDEISAPSGE